MTKHLLSVAIFLLSISIVYFGYQVGHVETTTTNDAVQTNTEVDVDIQKGLWTIEETASYLNLPSGKELKAMILQQDKIRIELGSYDTYAFIPYIKIRGEMYFNKAEVDKWIEYGSQNRQEY